MLGTVLQAVHIAASEWPSTIQRGLYYPHFTMEETEAR